MLLGIVTDIHESVDLLELGLREFRRRGVDQVINLGDACDLYGPESQLGRVVDQLRDAQAIGVWGNHDFGLCYDISDAVKAKADATVLDYMSGMRPFLTLEDCRFSHVEPWLNPHLPEEIWYFDGPPDSPEKAARSFSTVPEKRLFLGHFHRWLVVTPEEKLSWNGEKDLKLAAVSRALIVVAPMMSGWCATWDTQTQILSPIRVMKASSPHD